MKARPGLGRALTAVIKRVTRGRPRLGATVWDMQYAVGAWNRLDADPHGSTPLALVEKYAPDATILDLGCGTSANLPLPPGTYRHYHGVDISRTAIERARALGRPNTTFEAADILGYRSTTTYDVILLREVLYYLPEARIGELLRRLAGMLNPTGKIIIQIWDAAGFPTLVHTIRTSGLPLAEEHFEDAPGGLTRALFVLGAPAETGPR